MSRKFRRDGPSEKTVRLLDRLAEKLATTIADKIVNVLATRLADQIAQRIVYHQRTAGMTEDERDDQMADEALRGAGLIPGPNGWVAGPALAAKQKLRDERREQRRRDSGYYDEATVREREAKALEAKRTRAMKRSKK